MKALMVFTTLIYSSQVFCEYRVYQYYVRTKLQNITNVPAEVVTSTLNPVAYIAYHGGNEAIEVNLLRSWQCMGNTAKLPVCTVSEGKELEEVPVQGSAP